MTRMSTPKGTALVTGGARRIGAAIARALAQEGYDVALHYRTSGESAKRMAKEIEQMGRKCRLFSCDLNDHEATTALIPRCGNTFPT